MAQKTRRHHETRQQPPTHKTRQLETSFRSSLMPSTACTMDPSGPRMAKLQTNHKTDVQPIKEKGQTSNQSKDRSQTSNQRQDRYATNQREGPSFKTNQNTAARRIKRQKHSQNRKAKVMAEETDKRLSTRPRTSNKTTNTRPIGETDLCPHKPISVAFTTQYMCEAGRSQGTTRSERSSSHYTVKDKRQERAVRQQ